MSETWDNRKHSSSRKSNVLKFLSVEFGVAKSQVAPRRVRSEFAPAAVTETYEIVMYADEVLWWGDVVIDQYHPVWKSISDPGSAGSD